MTAFLPLDKQFSCQMVDMMIKDKYYFLHTQAFKTWPLLWDPELALTPVMTGELQTFYELW